LVLVNSVIDGLATYLMQALALPPGVIEKMDSKRRAFLWSGTDKTSGAKCLVNWETVQRPKTEGGLGIRDLATQNACLLLKLLHRLHHPSNSAWATWARQHVDLSSLEGDVEGTHWEAIRGLLPAYRCISKVVIGDGCSTSFWWDAWANDTPLAQRFPCLLSHSSALGVSVHSVCTQGLEAFLVPRLSQRASQEKAEVDCLIASTSLLQRPDERSSIFVKEDGSLHTSRLYNASTSSGVRAQFYEFVWRNYAPPRVKFFGWLLVQGRVHCKANLLKKHIVEDDSCDLCSQSSESCDHLFFVCPVARSFWSHLGWDPSLLPSVESLWEIPCPDHIPKELFSTLVLLCCWNIWNHRHDVVFRHLAPSLQRLLASCKATCRDWSCRLSVKDVKYSRQCNLLPSIVLHQGARPQTCRCHAPFITGFPASMEKHSDGALTPPVTS
jgi:hypothetical protein